MEDARKIPEDQASAPGTGAHIIALGTLPARHSTVAAEVLARIIRGEHLTGLETVIGTSTTRLAAFIWYLNKQYGWKFETREKAAGCKDGRVAFVSEYWLAPEACAAARKAGADKWCMDVFEARRTLRAKAAQARATAQRFNSKLQHRVISDPRQGGLWDSMGAAL